MRHRTWRMLVVCAGIMAGLGGIGSDARAATWADRLFSELSHDFGSVPRGAKVRHSFILTNRLSEPVNVVDVHASCGCTTGHASVGLVPPGGSATIDAEMDTRNFVGRKATVLYVNLVTTSGKQAEARLNVASTILSDIVLNPGTIDFGAVAHGQSPTLTASLDRIGMPTWRVERMVSACRAIDATLLETARNGQKVGYQLKVTLRPDAPTGVIRDEIRLFTNDPETPIFPIQLSAMIRGDLTASPSLLSLGRVVSSSPVQGKVLVRSSKPFVIRAVEGEGDGFSVASDGPAARPLHLLTVTFKPDEARNRGELRRVFRVHTDLVGESPLEVTATVHAQP